MQRQNNSIGLWRLGKTCQHHRKKVVWLVNQSLNLAKLDEEANTFLPLQK
jgi:hypothetical protein